MLHFRMHEKKKDSLGVRKESKPSLTCDFGLRSRFVCPPGAGGPLAVSGEGCPLVSAGQRRARPKIKVPSLAVPLLKISLDSGQKSGSTLGFGPFSVRREQSSTDVAGSGRLPPHHVWEQEHLHGAHHRKHTL